MDTDVEKEQSDSSDAKCYAAEEMYPCCDIGSLWQQNGALRTMQCVLQGAIDPIGSVSRKHAAASDSRMGIALAA